MTNGTENILQAMTALELSNVAMSKKDLLRKAQAQEPDMVERSREKWRTVREVPRWKPPTGKPE